MSLQFIFSSALQYVVEYPSPTLFGILAIGPTLFFSFRRKMHTAVASLAAAITSSLLIVGAEMLLRGLSALFPIGLALTFILLLPFCFILTAALRLMSQRLVSS
jgi:hypothetical protein